MGKNLKGREIGKGICQRKNGLYCVRYVDRCGKRIEKNFSTLAAARNWLADMQKQQITGDDDKPLVFGWASNAKDVIDVNTVEQPELEPAARGVLPPGEGNLEGPINGDDI